MSNNPIFRPLRMGQRSVQFYKHVCVFELERKGGMFIAEVVCTVCGAYLSSQQDRPPGTRQGRTETVRIGEISNFGSSTDCEKAGASEVVDKKNAVAEVTSTVSPQTGKREG
jgi:hypothetical protein